MAYYFSPDRKGEHPQGHLAEFKGVLQADAYGGFAKLYQATADTEPRVREAACWAHLRRDFHDIWKATASPVAKDALERIGRLYDIEREVTGQPAERRREARQNRSRPHVDAFRLWCEGQLARVPAKGDLAKAMRYALKSSGGTPSPCSSRTAALPSTTIPPSAPSGPWQSAARIGCSPAPTPAAKPSPTR